MSRDSPQLLSADALQVAPYRFRELQRVSLRCDFPAEGLHSGEAGTIVHAMTAAEAYLVEFVNPDGSTRAMVQVAPDQIALA